MKKTEINTFFKFFYLHKFNAFPFITFKQKKSENNAIIPSYNKILTRMTPEPNTKTTEFGIWQGWNVFYFLNFICYSSQNRINLCLQRLSYMTDLNEV